MTYGGSGGSGGCGRYRRYGGDRGPIGMVHRGGGSLAPENTLAAFASSVGLGYRYLESDVRATADGRLVLFHDATLERVTGATGPVSARTLGELTRLSVRGPDPAADSAYICPLEEALAAFPDACFSLDLKDPLAIEPLLRVLRRRGVGGRVCIAGAWDGWLDQVRAGVPGVATGLGWRALTGLLTCARLGVPAPRRWITGEFAHVPMALGAVPIYADAVVRTAHGLGVRVVTWTIDDPGVMTELLDAGVDAVITDRPDVLREVLLARDSWQPLRAPQTAAVR